MLTYWETLIARKSNITVSDSYAALWGNKFQSDSTVETYTGTLPATLTGTKVGYLESYKIYGNTVQEGTPTPENPIMPSGCGELETTGINAGQYKLPILSNNMEYPIYLGENQTTRRIKKLVLDGTEDWHKSAVYIGSAFTYLRDIAPNVVPFSPIVCTHLGNKATPYRYGNGRIDENSLSLWLLNESATVTDFKAFLAAQYAAGTPVTVWCAIAKPETAVVNEPLMKIGDYADTIDSTQSTVQIPTSAGATTISWAGEGLAPSEVELVYKVKG